MGNTGVKISKITLGTMQFGWRVEEEESFQIMDKALELGINCFDTADVYTSWADNSYPGKTEEIIGRWMKDRGSRDDLIIATKLFGQMSSDINNKGLSIRHIHQAIHGSFSRLKTDWIDLYQIHSFDINTPIEETLHGLNIQLDEGLINYIGASNIYPWQLIESLWMSEKYGYPKFSTLQPPYSIARRMLVENQFEHVVKKYKIGVLPYSPLGGGFLTGKYKKLEDSPDTPRKNAVKAKYFTEKRWKILETITQIAKTNDVSVAQVALAWVLSKDFITSPIIGANSVEQLEENLGALSVTLSQDELNELNEVSNWLPEYEIIR